MFRVKFFVFLMTAPLLAMAQPTPVQPAPAPAPYFPPQGGFDPDAYVKAEKCMRAYAVKFAPTPALPQDVADAALEVCHHERYMAAVLRMRGMLNSVTSDTLLVDEPPLRRVAVAALLEARYPKAR